MRIKSILNTTFITLCSILFIACDDDLNSIGGNIQPDGDGIFLGVDTVTLTAKTISLQDSVYARTTTALLGQYDDPIFGRIKSDYLCELYCPEEIKFENKTVSIDSVYLSLASYGFTGDSISPMGISVYEVVEPLKANFFTNIDPAKYTANMSKPLGKSIFTLKDAPTVNGMKLITTELNRSLGQRFFDEWKRPGSKTFTDSDELKKFFKGIYVTTEFGSGSLINIGYTLLEIHYTYTGRNSDDTADSLRTGLFRLPVTGEVIQANHIKNTIPESLLTNNGTKTYLKTPAGLCTEITIPLQEIMDKAGKGRVVNAANFAIKGFTEEEEQSKLNRPSSILLINRDSIADFFINKNGKDNLPNNTTSFVISRTSATNTYDFKNLSSIITHYAKVYEGKDPLPDLKYVVIPVQLTTQQSSTSSGTVTTITGVFNQMSPASAILRTDPANMKMSIVYSKFNNAK